MFEIGGALCWVMNGDGLCPSFGNGLIAKRNGSSLALVSDCLNLEFSSL